MSDEEKKPLSTRELPLPGVAAICLYLLLIAGIIVVGVAGGGHYPPLFLLFAALFMAARAGLVVSFRWAWALALSAGFLLTAFNGWVFASHHPLPPPLPAIFNLVFFF